MLGLGLGLTISPGGGGFNPWAVANDLWDAERADTLTLVGSAVSEWRSVKNGYAATQAVGGSRPVYSATTLNGRPALITDGLDDELTYAGIGNFPTGADAGEIWMLAKYTGLGTDTATKHLAGYGSATTYSGVRSVRRASVSNVNRATGLMGDGVTNQIAFAPGDCSGINVLRIQFGASGVTASRNGEAGATTAGTAATGLVQVSIGAGPVTAQRLYAPAEINFLAICGPLSTDAAAQMTAFLKARGGIA